MLATHSVAWQALGWQSRLGLEGRKSVVKMGSTAELPQFLTADEVARPSVR